MLAETQILFSQSESTITALPGSELVYKNFTIFDLGLTTWRFRNQKYQSEDIDPLFLNAKVIRIEVIYADFNKDSRILKNLTFPIYTNLHLLDIGNNEIYSIQSIKKLVAPNLQKLWLNNNNIVNIDCLQQGYFPGLKVLWLTDNNIKEIGWKGQWPQLTQLYIQKNNFDSISNILKMDHKKLAWSAISAAEGNEKEMLINCGKWQSRLRKKFRKLERVWMPAIFLHMQRRTR